MPIRSLQTPAVVSRPAVHAWEPARYLIASDGAPHWTDDPLAATAFASMREAARAALRLPSALRAFGLPLQSEITARQLH